jgi:hypothetical protein
LGDGNNGRHCEECRQMGEYWRDVKLREEKGNEERKEEKKIN